MSGTNIYMFAQKFDQIYNDTRFSGAYEIATKAEGDRLNSYFIGYPNKGGPPGFYDGFQGMGAKVTAQTSIKSCLSSFPAFPDPQYWSGCAVAYCHLFFGLPFEYRGILQYLPYACGPVKIQRQRESFTATEFSVSSGTALCAFFGWSAILAGLPLLFPGTL